MWTGEGVPKKRWNRENSPKEQSQQSKQEAGPKDVFLSLTDNCLCVWPLHFHINLRPLWSPSVATSSTLTGMSAWGTDPRSQAKPHKLVSHTTQIRQQICDSHTAESNLSDTQHAFQWTEMSQNSVRDMSEWSQVLRPGGTWISGLTNVGSPMKFYHLFSYDLSYYPKLLLTTIEAG